jgi:hypothetical protein
LYLQKEDTSTLTISAKLNEMLDATGRPIEELNNELNTQIAFMGQTRFFKLQVFGRNHLRAVFQRGLGRNFEPMCEMPKGANISKVGIFSSRLKNPLKTQGPMS